MTKLPPALRFGVPQALTAIRVMLAMYALSLIYGRQPGLAARLLLFGLVTDALDGACARRLGVTTDFGKLFDLFADYLYYVVAAAALSLSLVEYTGPAAVLLLSLPCLSAAIRYSRKAGLSETPDPGIQGEPGLPTLAYCLFVVALALLWRGRAIQSRTLAATLIAGAPILALLMPARIRYPKLSVYPWLVIPILAGLIVMPFAATATLSAITLGLICAYVLLGPFLVPQHRGELRDKPWRELIGAAGAGRLFRT